MKIEKILLLVLTFALTTGVAFSQLSSNAASMTEEQVQKTVESQKCGDSKNANNKSNCCKPSKAANEIQQKNVQQVLPSSTEKPVEMKQTEIIQDMKVSLPSSGAIKTSEVKPENNEGRKTK